MPVDGNVRITDIGGFDGVSLFDGCGDAELACFYSSGFFYNLTTSTTYVLRMSRRATFADVVDFDIEAFATIANDDCAAPSTITVEEGTVNTYSYDLREATESTDSSCDGASNTNLDVWYEFTMPIDGNVRITDIGGFDGVSLYDSCGGAELACFYSSGFFYNLTTTTTYLLRMNRRATFADVVAFDIEAFTAADNDDCATANSLNIGVVAPVTLTVDNRGASESLDATCDDAGNTNMDLWYTFVMPVDGNVEISASSSLQTSSFFDSCGGTEIACFSGNGTAFGLTGGQTYTYRLNRRAIFADEFSVNIQVIPSALAPCNDTTEWMSGAWSNGDPSITKSAIIRSNYDTSVSGSFTSCSLAIDNGTTLNVAPNTFVDVAYGIDVAGTLDVAHEGILRQIDEASTTIKTGAIFIRTTTPFLAPKDFMILGSPMDTETREDVYGSAYRVFSHDTPNFVPNVDVAAAFPMAENFADDNNDNWNLHTGIVNAGEGYLVRPQASNTDGNTTYNLDYTEGIPNNGDITFDVLFNTDKNSSPNMLSNPYPSPILADDFINANATISEVFFWEHLTPPSAGLPGANTMNFSMEDISMYNLMGGVKAASDLSPGEDTRPKGSISTSQGFGIKANSAGTATFTNEMRRLENNNTLRSTERERLWLTVISNEFELNSSTLIGFSEFASEEIDAGFDSRRLATVVSVYSQTESGSELGIQSREAFNTGIKIPIGFSTQIDKETTYSFSLSEMEGLLVTQAEVYLVDNLLNLVTNLTEGDYTFTAAKGDFKNRFTLVFKEQLLGVSEEITTSLNVYPNPTNGVLNVFSEAIEIHKIEISDVTGRVVKTMVINNKRAALDVSHLNSAVYFARFITDAGTITKKIVKR